MLIMAAVSLWWFLLMWQGVEGAGDRMERETIGRLLQVEGKPLSRIVDPYYFYRVVVLLLPWLVFYVVALASPLIKEIQPSKSSRLLWWISILTLAALHLTFNRRWYYQLPTLSVLCVLMAWVSQAIGGALVERGRAFVWKLVLAAHVLALFAALFWMWRSKPEFLKPPSLAVVGLGAICFVALALMFQSSRNHDRVTRPLILTALCSIALMVFVGLRVSPWKIERFHRRDFILEIGKTVPADGSLIGWHNDWQQEQYYLHRSIPSFERRNDLIAAIRTAPLNAPLWLLSNSRKPLDLPAAITLRPVHEVKVDVNEVVTLWQVESR
jgi:hypothetical protein